MLKKLAIATLFAASVYSTTFGNTTPFTSAGRHGSNYVLGVQVIVPSSMTLESFGLIYGLTGSPDPFTSSNAQFAIYSDAGGPSALIARTAPVALNAIQTYDNIAFTTHPVITPGTYWMMALYQSISAPRYNAAAGGNTVAYWSNSYAIGFPSAAPAVTTYTGQNLNYWINGTVVQAVPEPSTFALGFGAIIVLIRRRRA